jgi:hypothetical protein
MRQIIDVTPYTLCALLLLAVPARLYDCDPSYAEAYAK